ncbi:MAG: CRISPR system precrRNA processing endoribonuclease RAMP protein Cas6 [Ktedonobacteraceae bacterium]|nr:CRISPR system precrRNA processing endoribonuclease RAMP protein Cas6 [Ktedonobacteraceae bacterium]
MPFTFRSASLTTTHLEFTVQATTPLELDEYSGAALRGNFFNAIWARFCTNRSASTCAACMLHDTCPVSALVAPLREESPQGQDIPRPYVIVPPREARYYQEGDYFTFGMTLIGTIVQLLPYILLSMKPLEMEGVGRRLDENHGQRGRFRVERVECYHPFTAQRQTIYAAGDLRIEVPVITVQPQDCAARASHLSKEQITLELITPLRLIDREHTVRQASFRPLMQRLLERSLALVRYYSDQEVTMTREEKSEWLNRADAIRCSNDQTRWVELKSYSNRQRRSTPIGGLIGSATFEGDLTPFLDLLVMGELIHVGKNVVKGDGWYKIVVE